MAPTPTASEFCFGELLAVLFMPATEDEPCTRQVKSKGTSTQPLASIEEKPGPIVFPGRNLAGCGFLRPGFQI